MRRLLVILLLASPLLVVVPDLIGRAAVGPPTSGPALDPTTTRPDTQPLLGVAINAHHISDMPAYLRSVDRIADLGANALIVVTPMFQKRVDSNEIRFLRKRCPTDEQLIAILTRARERGLHTTLLPIVLIEKAGDKEWRGVIKPGDWNEWWQSYDAFLDRFISIANAAQVDALSVGSELNTTEPQVDRWRRIVERTRKRFPGRLTYSANWDRYDKVTFWPLVDFMSVSSYFELVTDKKHTPDVARLKESWDRERDKLLACAEKYDRPLVLSEVGYPSLPGAARYPWNYVAKKGTEADHAAQARCYEALFASWSEVLTDPDSRAGGLHCYHWDPYHQGDDHDTGYGVDGKPALEVIRREFAAIRSRQATD